MNDTDYLEMRIREGLWKSKRTRSEAWRDFWYEVGDFLVSTPMLAIFLGISGFVLAYLSWEMVR